MKKFKVFKDKEGNKLTFQEFITKWKSGIEEITPIQKIKTQLTGTKIMLLGLFLGLLVSIYGWKNLWWVGIILIGALINTGVQYLALRQQKKLLDNVEKQFEEDNGQETNSKDVSEGDTFSDNHASKKLESSPDTSKEMVKILDGKEIGKEGVSFYANEDGKIDIVKDLKEEKKGGNKDGHR